jgi:hypothetical protein
MSDQRRQSAADADADADHVSKGERSAKGPVGSVKLAGVGYLWRSRVVIPIR